MRMSHVTHAEMAILTGAKELQSRLWYVHYAISALFITLFLGRLYRLQQRPAQTKSNWRQYLKLVFPLFKVFPEI